MSQKITTLQERAHITGDIIGINAYNINHASLRQGLFAQGYHLHGTLHFLVGEYMLGGMQKGIVQQSIEERGVINQARTLPGTLIAHRIPPSEIDANIGYYIMDELKQFGLLTSPQRFGDVFGAIVMSLSPHEPERAWRLYATNTLTRYHALINNPPAEPRTTLPIDVFSSLYRRVCELHTGSSLLDAGCSFGFLPLVVAERLPTLQRVVGVDIETSPFTTSQYIATKRQLTNVQFQRADLLSNDVEQFGQFDMVTILHVLEHFTEEQMYAVLQHLLRIVKRRLIVAVPYEMNEPEVAYGHQQLFSTQKLEGVGRWCVEQLGHGTFEVEECVGGLLVVNV